MEFGVALSSFRGDFAHLFSPPITYSSMVCHRSGHQLQSPSCLKVQNRLHFMSSTALIGSNVRCEVGRSSTIQESPELADINWDNIGFGLVPTDYMYIAKSPTDGVFTEGELQRFGPIQLSPSAGILNYGQGLFEGLKAYRKEDGSIILFRPEENAQRMRAGAERMCMPSPTVEHFVGAVKQTVLANKRWVPPPGRGSLYIRPLLMGSGAVLGLAPAPEYTFLIFVSPVGNYFKEGLAPINLIVENEFHRAIPGGTGAVKTIGNYAAVLKAQSIAKAKGYSDVLYLDSIHNKYLEEVSSCNVFVVKDKIISTPAIKGTILPGITRKSIIEVAQSEGFQVEERLVAVDELLDADEVFCTGTAVVISPVGSITYLGKREKRKKEKGLHQLSSIVLHSERRLVDLSIIGMGRAPCCDKANVKKGPWSPEEDEKLKCYIEKHGTGGNWIALPQKIGLKRCGKSCRLRWLNYLRPNIKHGAFSDEEDSIICNLYIAIGSRWSIIAANLPGRTDNDIKNHWNTKLKTMLLGKQRKNKQNRHLKKVMINNVDQASSATPMLSNSTESGKPWLAHNYNLASNGDQLLMKLSDVIRFPCYRSGAHQVQVAPSLTVPQAIYETGPVNSMYFSNQECALNDGSPLSASVAPEVYEEGFYSSSTLMKLQGLNYFYGMGGSISDQSIISESIMWSEMNYSFTLPSVPMASNYDETLLHLAAQ